MSGGKRMKQKKKRIKSPKAQQQSLQRKRRSRQTRFQLATTALSAVIAVFTVSSFFHAEAFEVSGKTRYKQSELLSVLPVEQGDNLIFFNKNRAVRTLESAFPYLDEIEIKRQFPDKLEIHVTDREPVIAVTQGTDTAYLIDETGKVLDKKNQDQVGSTTQVIGAGSAELRVGSTIGDKGYEKLRAVLRLLALMEKYDLADRVNSVDITKSYEVSLEFGNSYQIEFGSVDDEELVEYKIQFLQAVLKKESLPTTGIIDLSDGQQARYRPLTGENETAQNTEAEDTGSDESTEDGGESAPETDSDTGGTPSDAQA
ncbi:MAG: cell division protein FtsQ/DivIB [Butyricicoccaceae bacterium]